MTDTKKLEPIRGITYTIKRWSFDDGLAVEDFNETHKKLKEQQLFTAMTGTVDPVLTEEEWHKADYEVIARLWYEILNYNIYDTTFLSLLRSLSPPGALPVETKSQ